MCSQCALSLLYGADFRALYAAQLNSWTKNGQGEPIKDLRIGVERHYKQEDWIGEAEAKRLLGIRGKGRSSLQKLRDNLNIEFSQFGRIIRYSRRSILKFLEENRRGLDRV